MTFTKFLSTAFFFSLAFSGPAFATTVAAPTLVCKSDGLAPAGEDDCSSKGGLVVMTGFLSDDYDQCIAKAEETDALPPHFTPWQTAKGGATEDADADAKRAAAARTSYCRGLYPLVNNADGSTRPWVGAGYHTKVAVSLDTYDDCVKRLKAASEIPLLEGAWKEDGVETFCKAEVKEAKGKFRSRWVQEGGTWSTPWMPNHDRAFCGSGANCNCGGENFCKEVKVGETVSYWPFGCGGAKWTLRCESESDDGSAAEEGKEGEANTNLTWQIAGPGDGPATNCSSHKRMFQRGDRCDKAGARCDLLRGNALAGGMSIEAYVCK